MAGKPKAKSNGKVRIADNGYKFPEQLPIGEKLIDSLKNEWLLGKAIARGGFGEIYEARPSLIKSSLSVKKNKDYEYVIKVDHFQGPLFCEMNFYIRAAKHEFITKWMSDKGRLCVNCRQCILYICLQYMSTRHIYMCVLTNLISLCCIT